MPVRENAICLRTIDYSETSQVVHFLTRSSGVVRLLAKGAKRPKSSAGGAIDLLAEGDLVFIPSRGEALGTLVEFAETTTHSALRRDARRLYVALYMIELVGQMVAEGDPHVEVFDLLHGSLARLAHPDAPAGAVLAHYQWRLLEYVGLLGEFSNCVGCGRPVAETGREIHFSSALGGLLCPSCHIAAGDTLRLDGPTLAGLKAIQAALATAQSDGPSAKRVLLPDSEAGAVNRLLAYHITRQLGHPLKLARYAIGPPP